MSQMAEENCQKLTWLSLVCQFTAVSDNIFISLVNFDLVQLDVRKTSHLWCHTWPDSHRQILRSTTVKYHNFYHHLITAYRTTHGIYAAT